MVLVTAEQVANALAEKAREAGLLISIGELSSADGVFRQTARLTAFAKDVPETIRALRPGDIVGPIQCSCGWLLVQVDRRQKALPDPETLEAVTNAVYQAWLQSCRASATIKWHWS